MIGQLLLIWIGCFTHRYLNDFPMWGIGVIGIEPDAPRPPLPSAPPINPCPDKRDGLSHPIRF